MAVASSGSISIKTAAGSGRSIDTDGRTDISSGSLVTLSTGDVVTSGNTIDGSAPHGMREFLGYQHIIDQSVTETWTLRNSDNSGTAAWIHSTTTSGQGAYPCSAGADFRIYPHTYNFNPVGTFTSITNNVYYYLGETYTTWNECSDFNAARTSTYTFEFQRSGNYANYITKGIKIRNENSHRQVGFC